MSYLSPAATTLFYFLSTVAQTFAAVFAVGGAFAVYRLMGISNTMRDMAGILKKKLPRGSDVYRFVADGKPLEAAKSEIERLEKATEQLTPEDNEKLLAARTMIREDGTRKSIIRRTWAAAASAGLTVGVSLVLLALTQRLVCDETTVYIVVGLLCVASLALQGLVMHAVLHPKKRAADSKAEGNKT